jgi:hypothetical protein
VLDVVEEHEQLLAHKPLAEIVENGAAVTLTDADRRRDLAENESRVAEGREGVQNTPSGNPSEASAAACKARRVFPIPPAPVSETRRASGSASIAPTTANSASRPWNGVAGTGRFVR